MLSKSTSGDSLYSHLDSARESEDIPGGFGGQSPPHQSSRYVRVSSRRPLEPTILPTCKYNLRNSDKYHYSNKVNVLTDAST